LQPCVVMRLRSAPSVSTSWVILAATLLALIVPATVRAQHPQPGDRLVIRIFGGEQLLADTILVSGNGTVVLPKLGPTLVTGFDIPTLPDSLRARYARYLRNPTVDVVVLRRVIVNGEVKKPDIYYVDVSATLPDVIAHAGGLTEAANSSEVLILRNGTTTRVPDWERSRASVGELQSGDQVFVGRRPWLQLNFVSVASTAAVLVSIFITLRR
jgi:protein involved in polysaccharide export with SLBB domain